MSEFMFMGFRMGKGVSKREFVMRFGAEIEEVFKIPLNKFLRLGVIEDIDGFYRISDSAFGISNSIMCEFIL